MLDARDYGRKWESLAALTDLSLWCVNSTMACSPEYKTTETSEAFPVTNGVKQGCILAPTLFNMMFTACWWMPSATPMGTVLALGTELMGNSSTCVGFRQRPMSRRLLFADETTMQQCVSRFSTACDNFEQLQLAPWKLRSCMHQPAPQKTCEPPHHHC